MGLSRSSGVARALAVASAIAGVALSAGCGGGARCAEVAAARDALTSRPGAADRGVDLRVSLPLARVNELLAATLAEKPLAAPLPLPELGPLHHLLAKITLRAVARSARVLPGPPGKLRLQVQLEIFEGASGGEPITELSIIAEVAPRLERRAAELAVASTSSAAPAEVVVRFGLENLLDVSPTLPAEAATALRRALTRWMPSGVPAVPAPLLDHAALLLAEHLAGAAYQQLRRGLLPRLGELTRLRLRLPDVPIADAAIFSVEWKPASAAAAPASSASSPSAPSSSPPASLVVELRTSLPVRRGLPPLRPDDPAAALALADAITLQLSPSTTAELANWSIDRGLAPRWYSRGLTPSADGEFRPRFDYLADDPAHPFQIYAFQERGGCSYFRVGVRAAVAMDAAKLQVTALDRVLAAASASPVIEVAAWVKYFLFGSVDLSRRLAASTRLSVGDRAFTAAVTGASLSPDDLRFSLALAAATQ